MLYFPGFAAACLVTHVVLPAPGKPIIITTYYDRFYIWDTSSQIFNMQLRLEV